ncbi:hypothetical protein DV735_g1873, partial [Chaetothyriales sp. CBS 134920]
MVFTVYKKKKNGETVPVKVSFWDVFHSGPPPKRKKDGAVSSSAFKQEKPKSQDAKHESKKDKPINKEGNSNSGSGSGGEQPANETPPVPANNQTAPAAVFTQKEDEIILRMKAELPAIPWTKIAEELGGKRCKNEINERYKVLKAKLATTHGDTKKPEENKTKAADNRPKTDKVDIQPRQAEAKQDQSQTQKNKDEKASAATPSSGSNVKSLADKYDKQKWMVIASRHFDKTGQRITPEQARKLAEGQ